MSLLIDKRPAEHKDIKPGNLYQYQSRENDGSLHFMLLVCTQVPGINVHFYDKFQFVILWKASFGASGNPIKWQGIKSIWEPSSYYFMDNTKVFEV